MQTLEKSLLNAEDVEFFHREGYFVARGFKSAAEVEEIRHAFDEQAKDGPVAGLSDVPPTMGKNDPLSRFPRMMYPHRHADKEIGALSSRHMLEPKLHEVLRQLFGEEPIAGQSMFYFKPPGARGQDFHQDNFYLRVSPGTCIAAWLAVDDADEENGGMMVVPTSNALDIACPEKSDATQSFTSEHVPIPADKEAITVRLKAGDLLFFNGSVIHGSFPNRSHDRFRRSLIFHYIPASCTEVSHYYHPLLNFDGEIVSRDVAQGGGPCGTSQDGGSPH